MAHRNAVTVKLSDIVNVSRSELNKAKLDALENSYDSFDAQLNSSSDPIALDKTTRPYQITNGRHRIFLARQKGYRSVPALLV